MAAECRSSGWFWLVQVAASVEAALLFVAGAYLRDAEALGFAFVVLLTLGWILFRPRVVIPVVVRSLVFADVAIWMVPATISNALNGGSLGSTALPAGARHDRYDYTEMSLSLKKWAHRDPPILASQQFDRDTLRWQVPQPSAQESQREQK